MRYAKSYIDNYFNSINDYHSKSELFLIAYGELEDKKENTPKWYIELKEIMNWQAMSDRSGVWTYYEVLYTGNSEILIESLKTKNENEILDMYISGIDNYSKEELMDEIDKWIFGNEAKIYKYIEDILIINKNWFYTFV